jgi:hypothetical protein
LYPVYDAELLLRLPFLGFKVLLVLLGFFADVLAYVIVSVSVGGSGFFHGAVEKAIFIKRYWNANVNFFGLEVF